MLLVVEMPGFTTITLSLLPLVIYAYEPSGEKAIPAGWLMPEFSEPTIVLVAVLIVTRPLQFAT